MKKQDCFYFGYVAKRVGNNGDIGIVTDVDNLIKYQKLDTLFLEINKSLIPFFVTKIKLSGKNATVTIDGITSIEQAEELLKAGVYLPLSYLPKLDGKKFYFHELPGFKVFDKNYGEIGVVDKILEMPQQAVFQIKKNEIEILIPAKEQFIVSINRTNKELHVCAPDGLIEIYLDNDLNKRD